MKRVAEACGVLWRPGVAARSFKFLTLISLVRVRCSAWGKFFWALEGFVGAEHFEQATLIIFAPS